MEKGRTEELPFFPHLTGEQRHSFLENTERICFRAGKTVYTPEQKKLGMIWVLSGGIRTVMVSEAGKKVPLFHLREGQILHLLRAFVHLLCAGGYRGKGFGTAGYPGRCLYRSRAGKCICAEFFIPYAG